MVIGGKLAESLVKGDCPTFRPSTKQNGPLSGAKISLIFRYFLLVAGTGFEPVTRDLQVMRMATQPCKLTHFAGKFRVSGGTAQKIANLVPTRRRARSAGLSSDVSIAHLPAKWERP